jgi:hypothetical protein
MFKDLEWRGALRRAGIFTGIWLALIYVLNSAFPENFSLGLETRAGQIGLLFNALLFFMLYTFVVAFVERSKKRRRGGVQSSSGAPKVHKRESADDDAGDAEPGALKGQLNPNTSRKKATRRRR